MRRDYDRRLRELERRLPDPLQAIVVLTLYDTTEDDIVGLLASSVSTLRAPGESYQTLVERVAKASGARFLQALYRDEIAADDSPDVVPLHPYRESSSITGLAQLRQTSEDL